jgi:hypothetical protein
LKVVLCVFRALPDGCALQNYFDRNHSLFTVGAILATS